MHVALVGTYPPTRCGIATFTADVEAALRRNGTRVTVVPVLNGDDQDPPIAAVTIRRNDRPSYVEAARVLNGLGVDVTLIQHEFGIFGGDEGAFVLSFAAHLDMPFAVTMHTVLPQYTDAQASVVETLAARASVLTVMTESARQLVVQQELAPAESLVVIPHGAPDELFDARDAIATRTRFGIAQGVPVMTTFGLLSEGKGIELALHAMAALQAPHPDLHYIIAGRTHPEVVKHEGERYRRTLELLSEQLGLAPRVHFIDRFMDVDELGDLLGMSSIVCTPYRGEHQSVSGVLTFALAAGCPVVSTPYRYAEDMLADGAGRIAALGDVDGFAAAIAALLDGPLAVSARDAARQASSTMRWPRVGAELRNALDISLSERSEATGAIAITHRPVRTTRPSTSLALDHLRLLCDDTAMLQHAHHGVPRHEDGYCVDDAVRMLPIAEALALSTGDDEWTVTMGRLLGFVRAASLNGGGQMRNFMTWDRRWIDAPHFGDHVGRAIWGLGEVVRAGGPFAEFSADLVRTLAPTVEADWPTRSIAYAALGLVAAASIDSSWDPQLDPLLDAVRAWQPTGDRRWRWFEPELRYDNARLPEALIRLGLHTGDRTLVDRGGSLLEWLERLCRQGDHYRFPGHRGMAGVDELNWSGDEQPLEASAMADAQAAWFLASGDATALASIERSWTWFHGANRLGEVLIDPASGACFDGLGERGVNLNKGAESTIAAHRCALTAAWGYLALAPSATSLSRATRESSKSSNRFKSQVTNVDATMS